MATERDGNTRSTTSAAIQGRRKAASYGASCGGCWRRPKSRPRLREKLDEGFRIRSRRSGEEWPVPMHPRPVLYTDLNGYAIKPHPDTRRKVLTMQIYLPSDDSQRELGTAIYKISPMGVFAWKSYGLVEGQDRAFPAELRLRLRRHPSGLFASEVELARAGGDFGSGREAAAVDPQHVLPRPPPQPAGDVRHGWPRRPAFSPSRSPKASARRSASPDS